jgi:prepilin-type N-terminal cleavage/methylation domain-containing protein
MGPTTASRRAFTLIELMAVMGIMGVLLLAVVPAVDNMVPAYRVRAAARTIASTIELGQSETVAQRKEFVLVYDLGQNTFEILLPPSDPDEESDEDEGVEGELAGFAGDEDANEADDIEHGRAPPDPSEEDEEEDETPDYSERDKIFAEKPLPEDVVFELVVVGEKEHRSGKVFVPFSHLGNKGAHYVGIRLDPNGAGRDDPIQIWVKFNPMTRTIEYSDERPQIRTLSAGGE